MSVSRWLTGRVARCAVGCGAWAAAASGETLRVLDAGVFLDGSAERVWFELSLNREPNWPLSLPGGLEVLPQPVGTEGLAGDASESAALDGDAGPAEGFQFLLDVTPGEGEATDFPWEVVVRGTEASVLGIPLRDAGGSAAVEDPNAGGWGAVLGVADFEIDGGRITFSAPNAWVGASAGSALSYELIVLEDQTVVDRFVPTPTALGGGLLLLAGMVRKRTRG